MPITKIISIIHLPSGGEIDITAASWGLFQGGSQVNNKELGWVAYSSVR